MSDSLIPRFGRVFPAGEVLFREGESGDVMFVIQSGVVRVSKAIHGNERTLATFGRGDFLGEMAILNEKPRTATATVVEDATALVIDGKTLETMISNNADIALRLIKKLALRIDAADHFIQILLHPDPEARVMLGLQRLAESLIAVGEARADGGEGEQSVELRLTPEELAREVGAQLVHVHDVLRRLGRLHIASEGPDGTVVVEDLGRLLEFLEFLDVPRKSEGR
jgi:CRP-like cAMP-binding protein